MSWHCSRALAVEFWAGHYLVGDVSAQLNTTPTPDQYYWPDKTTEHSRLSRFGMTCVLLTDGLGEDLLTWYREVFLVRTSRWPARAQELKVREADSGAKWQGSFAKFDPDTLSWKTAQCSLLGGSEEFSETWPKWGSMRNGESYPRTTPALPTYENASGLWPTPDASCGKRGWSKTIAEKVAAGDRKRKSGAKIGSSLAWEPRLLTEYTPGARLNPEFVEWLMGWPIAHTALSPLETAKFQSWLQQHGKSSQVNK